MVQVPDFRRPILGLSGRRPTHRFLLLNLARCTAPSPASISLLVLTGKAPYLDGIAGVFQSKTNLGVIIPRAFMDDTVGRSPGYSARADRYSHLSAQQIHRSDTRARTGRKSPSFPSTASGEEEAKWVQPETFFDELGAILKEVPPLPGEEALYANLQSVLDAAAKDPKLHAALVASAVEADRDLITPLFQFHNSGLPLAYHWTTINNGAAFGIDYYTRAAVAKSNIFVNSARETKYFYQDSDGTGQQLNGAHAYTCHLCQGQLPPVKGFWSLTLYNQHHFFSPNEMKRYSVGTKNKTLVTRTRRVAHDLRAVHST